MSSGNSTTKMTMDGNMAAAHVAYAFTETAGIYPITPSSDMAEHVDSWAASGKKNIFGQTVKVVEMQSEGGASGVMHGALQAGALTSTFTASQGLLLMLPNMYKIAGEQLPGVFHVSARQVATHALSIFGEHSDVYSARPTGVAILASGSVQQVMDIGAVAHLAAISSSMPFLHFFDGFRTSHEIQKIDGWNYETLSGLVDREAITRFRNKALNPEHPVTRGTAQNPDIYFQAREACNHTYEILPDIVNDYLKKISKLTGRDYRPFTYYGAPNAEYIIVAMGSVTETIRETIDYMSAQGEKVGLISVHLFRPFSAKYLQEVLPASVRRIAVLDRSKEPGSTGEPLFLDVKNVLSDRNSQLTIVGGRYGLASKDTTPSQILAVYENLKQYEPKNNFTIGIVDDVTFSSLPMAKHIETVPAGTVECKFYGLGADGTVGANKNSIKIIGDHTDMYAQGYFAYDSKKSGGVTISHLRFGKKPIQSTYYVNNPTFVSCSTQAYLGVYDMLRGIKKGGTFLLNTIWDEKEIVNRLPDKTKKQLADNNVNFYIINATQIAEDLGLGRRTNSIMQSAFFKLANVIPFGEACDYMKKAVVKSYQKKGDNIVKMNIDSIEQGAERLVKVAVNPEWKNLVVDESSCVSVKGVDSHTEKDLAKFLNSVAAPMNCMAGDDLPVSAFAESHVDGTFPNGSCAYEKRGIATSIPEWVSKNCIQCNQCAYVCPHAAIRPFLLDEKEMKGLPNNMDTLKAIGKEVAGHSYRIQVAALDCTGCGVCVSVCPAKEKSLVMKPLESQAAQIDNWDYLSKNVTYKDSFFKKNTVKGSQFAQPLFEFSGACSGCGETPYIKAATQLFGDRMMIANATGCSSIYGGSAPATPYCKNAQGHGPAWANSLFEDNAEYGGGMAIGVEKIREQIASMMTENMNKVSPTMQTAFNGWLEARHNGEASKDASAKLVTALAKESSPLVNELKNLAQYFVKKSIWIIGGDGWAYDIGFGGLDHVLSLGEDLNMLVLDTEVYSNTGGQASKASVTGQVAKFAAAGKRMKKKDLGRIAMTYGNVYVAQVAMGANQAHYLKVLSEAEAYPGPSLIIAYSPCIAHGIKDGGMTHMMEQSKLAVECGYWHLYRYNPLLEKEGKNPFVLDSKPPKLENFAKYLSSEVRFASLATMFPEEAKRLFALAQEDAKWRYDNYRRLNDNVYGTTTSSSSSSSS
ncbi:MAG: pyruvate:ferredoxin (flavodoxin) oxidoreductase [Bdellovibrionales bacterium RIFOXYD12_FULL_39_22]|nr:MAG: pyruvate:ferredoxin (flavodoxin) oxidoreductase [Bdellovibrionales bacterium RIFOXYB1_FULL_39_21]OFZ41302.1 MAG: pyruvate:ferredoxin (flavodoxin) oxidoreductase [Bdellovibrionales bacterium RIFOXYC12_FULL_39_17]OFZ45048.1 MAG: pyruvate:ferredoxin (flavodoxin) oxidoreductase [Bdellovibrionales bacterium RIFOXYC1_FULL_39_130]OFZ74432.1 MAG: pyruvate:ferredoxin (flavodoxin) oxidoreductase [Bdellovibrionales bacterium RIFOXYD1_FULL_39_84]OFZ92444.1 MAG: pyruvate:ferredoxin (flavodoxin) oxid